MCQYQSVCPPTFRYEESFVVEVRESIAAVVFSFPFLIALLADDERCEGAIYRVIGHLLWREDRGRNKCCCLKATRLEPNLPFLFGV